MKINTLLLHGGRNENPGGATMPPIFCSSAFEQSTAEKMERIFQNQAPGFAYSRISNPTTAAFENRITALEGGIASVAAASGMAAVTAALLNILESGDEIISLPFIFGGTLDLFKDLEKFGIKVKFVKEINAENLSATVNENTKAVFAETIGNPKLNVVDISSAADTVHSFGLPFILDNTAATVSLVRGIEYGADIIINSSSKYINGNSNSISGIITDSGNFAWSAKKYLALSEYIHLGKYAFTARLRNDLYRNIGCCLSPANAFFNLIGIETLGLRMERHCENALKLAEFLENCTEVKSVNYPMLDSSPYKEIAQRQFGGKGGGILTVRLGSKEKAFALINNLKNALNVSNIGDTKTLVIHPASTIYAHSSIEETELAGVYDDMIRVSVGIEDVEDIIEDFGNALKCGS